MTKDPLFMSPPSHGPFKTSHRWICFRSRLLILASVLSFTIGCEERTNSDTQSENSAATSAMEADNQRGSRQTTEGADRSSREKAELQFVAPHLTGAEIRQGWVSLFDGVSLFGWNVPTETNWRVENGSIVADSGSASLLTTKFRQADFELRCDFRSAPDSNSGLFLRNATRVQNAARDTYELNICDHHPKFRTGSLVGRTALKNSPTVQDMQWHTLFIRCLGNHIEAHLDGQPILDFDDDSEFVRLHGTIGLQKNSGRIEFRNIFLRPLSSTELFNGHDLSGFREVPGSQATFSVKDELLHVASGRGYLETERTFANFVLHVESNINDQRARAEKVRANSGVFFRAMTGTADAASNGYEMQIQHDFKNNDRRQPADFGSGGIYRRQPARYIVADNNQWVTQTLIADGLHFASFVNGYQVLSWNDTRPPNPNPRQGSRLDGGHFSLQGHDPTTDLNFRSLRVTVLPD